MKWNQINWVIKIIVINHSILATNWKLLGLDVQIQFNGFSLRFRFEHLHFPELFEK